MSGTEGDISALRTETIELRAQLAGITAERDAARADAEAAAAEVRGDVLNSSCRDILRHLTRHCAQAERLGVQLEELQVQLESTAAHLQARRLSAYWRCSVVWRASLLSSSWTR